MGTLSPKTALGGNIAPTPPMNHWFNNTLSEGAPKDAFARKVTILRKSPKMVKPHHFRENGWNLMKIALCREIGASWRPNSRPNPERYGRRPSTCRIGPARTRAGGLATPSKRSAVRRRLRPPPSLQCIYIFNQMRPPDLHPEAFP